MKNIIKNVVWSLILTLVMVMSATIAFAGVGTILSSEASPTSQPVEVSTGNDPGSCFQRGFTYMIGDYVEHHESGDTSYYNRVYRFCSNINGVITAVENDDGVTTVAPDCPAGMTSIGTWDERHLQALHNGPSDHKTPANYIRAHRLCMDSSKVNGGIIISCGSDTDVEGDICDPTQTSAYYQLVEGKSYEFMGEIRDIYSTDLRPHYSSGWQQVTHDAVGWYHNYWMNRWFVYIDVADTTNPVISDVHVTPSTDSAGITWYTDEEATTRVEYGYTTSYGSTRTGSGYTTEHSVSLSSLTSNTGYYYRITSCDRHNNCANYAAQFTTVATPGDDHTAPGSVTGLQETTVTETSITWIWTNPSASDFKESVVLLDGSQVIVTSGTSYTASGLIKGTQHTLEVRTRDINSNTQTSGATDSAWTMGGTSVFTVADVTLGSSSQARDAAVSGTFRITNNGQAPVIVSQITSSAASKYNVVFSNQPTTVAPGSYADVTVSAHIPEDLDAVDSSCKPAAIEVGSIQVIANSATKTAKILMQAENELVFDEVEVSVDGDEDTVTDGDTVDVKPNSAIEVNAVVQNNDGDLDMENVDFTVQIDDEDLEVDEEESIGDVDADDDGSATIAFSLDYDIEDSYKMQVMVCGEDENGAKHGDFMEVDLEVDKEQHQLVVDSVEIMPSSITCDRDVLLNVKLVNLGKSDEEDITIRATSSQLQVLEQSNVQELKEGKSRMVTFPITVPDSARAATYTFIVEVGYSEETLRETAQVIVGDCEETLADTGEIEVMYSSGQGSGSTTAGVEQTTEEVQKESSHVAVLEIAVISLLVLLIALGVYAYFRMRKQEQEVQPVETYTDYYKANQDENSYYKTN